MYPFVTNNMSLWIITFDFEVQSYSPQQSWSSRRIGEGRPSKNHFKTPSREVCVLVLWMPNLKFRYWIDSKPQQSCSSRKRRRREGRSFVNHFEGNKVLPSGGAFWSILNVFYYSLLRNRKTLRTLESGHFNLRRSLATYRLDCQIHDILVYTLPTVCFI